MFDEKKKNKTVTTEPVRVCENVAFLSLPLFSTEISFFYERARQKGSWNQHKAQNNGIETQKHEQTIADQEIEYVRSVGSFKCILFIYKISEWHSERDAVGCSVGRFLLLISL